MTIRPKELRVPELHSGDHMTRQEFHRIYLQTPEDFKAELIGGIVYVASPVKLPHSTTHLVLGTCFGTYVGNTLGTEAGDNGTQILSEEDEPQPDLYLRILPEYGGQSQTTEDDYVGGAPELNAEVSHSTRSIDLHTKKDRYARFGVREYLVVSLREAVVRWFDLQTGEEFQTDANGVLRSRVFPGLWLHVEALLNQDYHRLLATLNQGLATEEHAAFLRALTVRRDPSP